MDKSLRLVLPWPPSINHYWGQRVYKGRAIRFIGAKGKQFRADVEIAVSAYIEPSTTFFRETDRLGCLIYVYPPDRRKRDLDNLLKSTQDALEHGGAFPDDSQIDVLQVYRQGTHKGGKIEVILTKI